MKAKSFTATVQLIPTITFQIHSKSLEQAHDAIDNMDFADFIKILWEKHENFESYDTDFDILSVEEDF